jgi:Zn-dependent peptidase ImmA (M78 family)
VARYQVIFKLAWPLIVIGNESLGLAHKNMLRNEIEELAEAVANDAGAGPVTDIEQILSSEGITVSTNDYGDHFDGMLEYSDGRFHIYCNLHRSVSRDSGRARFTLGHELGHYFIDEHREGLLNGSFPQHASHSDYQTTNPVERQADTFAANLLLPKQRFLAKLKRVAFSIDGIRSLAALFQTSLSSTAIRYVQLSPRPCAVVRWTAGKVTWMSASEELEQGGLRWVIASQATLPKDSATARALATSYGYREQQGTVASAWFSPRGPLVWKNAILIEQAFALGNLNALTFLYLDRVV